MPDLPNGAAPAAAEDDLHAELSAAFAAAAEPPSTPEPSSAPTETAAPAAETPPAGDDRPRDEHGRFAPKEAAAKAVEAGKEPAAPQTPQDPAKAVSEAPAATETPAAKVGPPPGWPVAAKGAWDKPAWDANDVAAVKAAVQKREDEINKGFADLREFKVLKPYVEASAKAGVPLKDALDRYMAADNFLERDPAGAIKWFAQTYNVDLRALVGAPAAQPQPAQTQTPQQPAFNPQVLQPHLQPLLAEIEGLKRTINGDKQASVQNEINQFFSDPANRYAENVAPQMEAFIRSGQAKTLAQAHEMATWANPEIRALLISEQTQKAASTVADKARAAAASARAAGKSITGAPPATPAIGPQSDNLRAEIEAQFAAARA